MLKQSCITFLFLLPLPSYTIHIHNLGQMAGAVQQVSQTVAAGLAANTQWFQPSGTGQLTEKPIKQVPVLNIPYPGASACSTEAVSAQVYQGWPGYQGNNVTPLQAVCSLEFFFFSSIDHFRWGLQFRYAQDARHSSEEEGLGPGGLLLELLDKESGLTWVELGRLVE